MIRALALMAALLPAPLWAECRQALALGLDVSGSVDAREYRLQLDGLAGALGSDAVREALLGQPEAPVRLTVYEWSGPRDIRMLVPWTEIDDGAALAGVIGQLQQTQRRPAHPSTALGVAMEFGFALLDQQPDCWKRTLDISGDGKANNGPRPQDVGNGPPGVTVNGLVIADVNAPTSEPIQELIAYFRAYVLRGPDAFVEMANGFDDYEAAMARKLLRELQALAIGRL